MENEEIIHWAKTQLTAYFKGVIPKKDLSAVAKKLRDTLYTIAHDKEDRRRLYVLLGLVLTESDIGLMPPTILTAAHDCFDGNIVEVYIAVQELRKNLKPQSLQKEE